MLEIINNIQDVAPLNIGTLGSSLLCIPILIIISLTGRAILIAVGQTWIKTYAHTATITLLPIITMSITSIIAGNIALSLGMIGALSIVRFRNPVKSPFELSIYFAAITLGIAASVSIKWVFFLTGALGFALLAIKFLELINSKIFKREYFAASFSEGNSLSTLEITSENQINILDNSPLLSSVGSVGNNCNYLLVSNDWSKLKSTLKEAQNKNVILDFRMNK